MNTAARIALGIVLGAALAALPLLHYGLGGGHRHTRGESRAHHTR